MTKKSVELAGDDFPIVNNNNANVFIDNSQKSLCFISFSISQLIHNRVASLQSSESSEFHCCWIILISNLFQLYLLHM